MVNAKYTFNAQMDVVLVILQQENVVNVSQDMVDIFYY